MRVMDAGSPLDVLVSLCLGVALAAACGLRVFLPLLVAGAAARLGYWEVAGGMSWLASTPALVAFAVATVLELAAYLVPWLDNALDAIGAPVAVTAGTLLVAASLGEVSPLVRWTLAVVAGGGAAGAVHGLLAVLRKASSLATLGLANPAIGAAEGAGALLLAVFAVALPILAAATVLLAAGLLMALARSLAARRRVA